jgi:hypothetical protein
MLVKAENLGGSLEFTAVERPREIITLAVQFFSGGSWIVTSRDSTSVTFRREDRPSGVAAFFLCLLFLVPASSTSSSLGGRSTPASRQKLTTAKRLSRWRGVTMVRLAWPAACSRYGSRKASRKERSQRWIRPRKRRKRFGQAYSEGHPPECLVIAPGRDSDEAAAARPRVFPDEALTGGPASQLASYHIHLA